MGLGLDIDTDIPIDPDKEKLIPMTITYLLGFWFQVSVAPDIGMIGQGEIVSKVDNLYTRFQVSGFSRQGQGEIVSKDNNLYTRFQVSVDKQRCKNVLTVLTLLV